MKGSEGKLPAFQFYPGDWRRDPAVQSLSYFDRGVWLEILCLMHESEQRGKLLLNGKKMPNEALARLLGLDKQILTKTLDTLLEYGVASIDEETEALMSRRMVRDEKIRQIRKEVGKKGGNPNLVNQKSNQTTTKNKIELNQNSTPSSSSSSSTTNKISGGNSPPATVNFPENGFQNRQWIELTVAEKKMTKNEFVEHLQVLYPGKNISEIAKKLQRFCKQNQKNFALERLKGWVFGEGETFTDAEFLAIFGEELNGNYINPNTGKSLK